MPNEFYSQVTAEMLAARQAAVAKAAQRAARAKAVRAAKGIIQGRRLMGVGEGVGCEDGGGECARAGNWRLDHDGSEYRSGAAEGKVGGQVRRALLGMEGGQVMLAASGRRRLRRQRR